MQTTPKMSVRDLRTGAFKEPDYGKNKAVWDAQKSLSDQFKDKDARIRDKDYQTLQLVYERFNLVPKSKIKKPKPIVLTDLTKEKEYKKPPELKSL